MRHIKLFFLHTFTWETFLFYAYEPHAYQQAGHKVKACDIDRRKENHLEFLMSSGFTTTLPTPHTQYEHWETSSPPKCVCEKQPHWVVGQDFVLYHTYLWTPPGGVSLSLLCFL